MRKYDNPMFALYDGYSNDGRGNANYVGRTTDPSVAYEHYKKVVDNPYSTGYVRIYTDTLARQLIFRDDLEWIEREANKVKSKEV